MTSEQLKEAVELAAKNYGQKVVEMGKEDTKQLLLNSVVPHLEYKVMQSENKIDDVVWSGIKATLIKVINEM